MHCLRLGDFPQCPFVVDAVRERTLREEGALGRGIAWAGARTRSIEANNLGTVCVHGDADGAEDCAKRESPSHCGPRLKNAESLRNHWLSLLLPLNSRAELQKVSRV
jgi:hypothetical protein